MDVRQLTYFLGVVTHGGFGRAASQLHVSQPALSQSVAALERDLGVPLLHRVPSGVRLTDAGRALVPHARQVLRELDAARAATRAVGEELTGQIDLALMPSQGVEPFASVMRRLVAVHPRLIVNAHASFVRDEAIELVRTGTCEMGLVGALATPYPAGIEVHTLGHQEMVLVVPEDSPLPGDRPLTARDLDGQRIVVSPPGSVMRQMADRLMGGSTMTVVVETAHRSAILPLVLAGVGVAVLSSAWESLAREAGARVCRLADPMQLQVDVIHRPTRLTPAAQALLTLVEKGPWPGDISVMDGSYR
ncbi:putative transcriptional regulator, LysR family [Serinicoccus hydrothermalis]|uniref:Putative transcriptional regulator, LysR family n=1 Tax=Serinicoccus hydrothermalis TaxID=1758689 RepID=A0A1B1N9R9_9MICO|nr:LysR family transcriptional regulator [Serinicoccus hydrothermalis]ANS78125.1 putative transcriptional regulator, LysR family [Serinicoccus hydrothermalis]